MVSYPHMAAARIAEAARRRHKVDGSRDTAGNRFRRLELHTLLRAVVVTGDPYAAAAQLAAKFRVALGHVTQEDMRVRATLIGHACWLIETAGGRFLTDPVFFDPFEEDTVVSCPRREVHVERLPALQGVFLSHQHLDHFDLRSLAALDRRLPIFCPEAPLLVYGLRHLGFTNLHFLTPFVPHQLDGVRLLPTPSLHQEVQECGLVLQDSSGTLFNQVDTFLAPEAVERLRQEVGPVDVHLAMYASQHFGFFESQQQHTAALHAVNLNTVRQLNARCVIPASAGFRFTDELAWLNAHVFPISRERFLADLGALQPAQQSALVNPADTVVLTKAGIDILPQVAPYVTLLEEDTWRLAYDPSAPVPPLHDANPAGYGLQGLQEFAQGVLEVGLTQYLHRGCASGTDPVVQQYLAHAVVYQVEVVFPDAARLWTYTFDPQGQTFRLRRGQGSAPPQMTRRITASALVDFCLGRRSYVSIRTRSRQSSLVFRCARGTQGIVVQEVRLPDLLTHFVVHAMAGANHRGADWVHFATRDFGVSGRTQ